MERTLCNTGRQNELDIAKGLAVVFMVLIHTVEYFWDEEAFIFGKIVNFLGSPPAAPVFMFLLGCGIVYSTRSNAEMIFKRGIKMLALSYVMNALVYVLPWGIKSLIDQDINVILDEWTQIYDADILQFAALAFLFFAIVKKVDLKPLVVVVIAAVISGVGMALNYFIPEIESPVLQAISGLFWGTHEGSYFPFTSWIIYPAAGYLFAHFLRRTDNKKSFYALISTIGLVVFVSLAVVLSRFIEWDDLMDGAAYYHQGLALNVMFIAFVLFWLGVCYALSLLFRDGFIMKLLAKFSSNVTPIYVCQYILIIYVSTLATYDCFYRAPVVTAIFIVFTILAYFMAAGYKKVTKKSKEPKKA